MTTTSTPSKLLIRLLATLAALLAVALLAAACSSADTQTAQVAGDADPPVAEADTSTPDPQPTTSTTSTSTTAPPEMVETIEWTDCGRLQCATVDVPIDYEDPDSETIAIAINKRSADRPEERIGYLLTNPGGPGATGLGHVQQAEGLYDSAILDRFDIIGFDPRGTGESEPALSCGTDAEQSAIIEASKSDAGYPEYPSPEYLVLGEALIDLCFAESGPAFSRVHAEYVARDMDEIRAALGADEISFHGLSWGAHIGVWYATLFPDHTRAMVIDAALDPTQVGHTRIEMATAYEGLFRQALEACDSTCPIYNDGDPVAYYLNAIEKFDLVAEAMGEGGNLGNALLEPVYSAGSYPALWEAIFELGDNDNPLPFVELGSTAGSNPTAAELAIVERHDWTRTSANCVDEFVLHPQVTRDYLLTEEVVIEQPLLNAAFAGLAPADESTGPDLNFCAFLQPTAPASFTGTFDGGNVPIVVVANAFEGPVPYGQSKTMASKVLADGYLVDVLGSRGHVVYPLNQCVVDIVDAHLLTLALPNDAVTTCEAESLTDDLGDNGAVVTGDAFDKLAEQRFGQCVGRVMAAIGDIDEAQARATLVCEALINAAVNAEGPSGLENVTLLDRLLDQAIEDAQNLPLTELGSDTDDE